MCRGGVGFWRNSLRACLLGSVGANITPSLMQPNFPFDPLRDYVPGWKPKAGSP